MRAINLSFGLPPRQAQLLDPSLQTVDRVAEALGLTAPVLLAQGASEELIALLDSLPEREREYVRVMVRALVTHVHTQ